ncbi:hypothetical protein K438DRAFT_1555943 [Mycena galopus ATCC 62051]|nr:hypothetical protein K438DRAFT_1555943 [Mycena galopus ATCC 62051]
MERYKFYSQPHFAATTGDFVLYDLTGVHKMNVDFCGCGSGPNGDGPPTEHRTQLLRTC